jgi:uncharacterized protein
MQLKTFEELCKKLSANAKYDSFYFVWHGGEPLLLGIDFYNKCIKIQETYFEKKSFFNTFQTNCTLIDSEWISWFKERNIKISASLDGNKEVHDINRIKNGKGTFDEIFQIIQILKQNNLLSGVVAVLSKTNINHINEIIEFFAKNEISPRLNPILPSERVLNKSKDLNITPDEYADALIQCFDIWFNNKLLCGKKISIEPLEEIIYNFFNSEEPNLCAFSKNCSEHFIAMNSIGDLYNCGAFCDISKFKIANIYDNISWEEIFNKKAELLKWNIQVKDDCCNCKWLRICNRGCPNISYLYDGVIKDKDPYCKAYKKIFEYLYNHVKMEIYNTTH